MYFDYDKTKYPYDIKGEQDCVACGYRFPVHNDFMAESRCLPCQIKFRLDFARRCQKDPTLREEIAILRKRTKQGPAFW